MTAEMMHLDPENNTSGHFLLLTESEWYTYSKETKNVSIFFEKRRKLSKLTSLEISYCFLYSILFVVGIASNAWAIRIVGTVLFRSGGRHVNILAYIGTLALVNLVILAFLPITISDMIVGEWLLPVVLCPVHWIIETMNKTVSPLLLACLTVACYCAVCQPQMVRMYRCAWVAALHITAVAAIVAWKAKPFVDNSAAFHLINFVNDTSLVNYGKKCLFHPLENSRVAKDVTWDGFLSIYLLPMIYMIVFYMAILRTIMVQSRTLGRRAPPRHFWRAARSAALLVGFYFFCWTPYWSITLALILLPGKPNTDSLWSAVAFIAHVLPLINCAFAPLLYTLTNSHVRTVYRTAVAVREQQCRSRSQSRSRSRSYSSKMLEDNQSCSL